MFQLLQIILLIIISFFFIIFIWFNLLFSIFLKCGLVPFYFWKPAFFKGMPLHSLFFYIVFFYFFIFIYFLYFFLIYLNEIFYFFTVINMLILCIGFFILLFILCEAFYLKAFLAMSSILNTLFVFLALNGINSSDFFFNVYIIAVLKSRKNLRKKISWAKKFTLKNNSFFFNKKIKNKFSDNKSSRYFFNSFYYL